MTFRAISPIRIFKFIFSFSLQNMPQIEQYLLPFLIFFFIELYYGYIVQAFFKFRIDLYVAINSFICLDKFSGSIYSPIDIHISLLLLVLQQFEIRKYFLILSLLFKSIQILNKFSFDIHLSTSTIRFLLGLDIVIIFGPLKLSIL